MKKFIQNIVSGILIGFVVMIIDQTIRYFSGISIALNESFFKSLLYYMIFSIPLTLVNAYFFDYLNSKVVWKRYSKLRMPIGFFGSVSLTLVTIFLYALLYQWFWREMREKIS
jgi:hypothetical protein